MDLSSRPVSIYITSSRILGLKRGRGNIVELCTLLFYSHYLFFFLSLFSIHSSSCYIFQSQEAHLVNQTPTYKPIFKNFESTTHTAMYVPLPYFSLTILITSLTGLLTSFLFHSTHTVSMHSTTGSLYP